MIVKKNIIIMLVCTLFEGMVCTMVGVGWGQLKTGEHDYWRNLVSMWWFPILISGLIILTWLLDAIRGIGEKVVLDSCGISKRSIGPRGETKYCLFKSWEELILCTGKWSDWGGFVFSCPPETDGDSKWIKFFKVNIFLANRKQLMEFAVKHIPKENISDWTLLRLKKMGIYI
jgi:hypothetical protein